MNEIQDNFYRGTNTTKNKRKGSKTYAENFKLPNNSKEKTNVREEFNKQIDQAEENAENQEMKAQNLRLKKMLKQAQVKRTQITRQCSELTKRIEMVEEENEGLIRKLKDGRQYNESERYRLEELKFLNKELSTEIEQLRNDNEELTEKLRYQTQIIERKYEDLEERTFKRIQQAMKRVKKGIHYLNSLTAKEIQKTKEILIENLKKTVEILRGKYTEDRYEEEIEELMNPIKNIQQELHLANKQLNILKEENQKLEEQVRKHKKIEKELMPQYREAIEKLKKNLYQLRSQLSENQYDKSQIKLKYEERIKENQIKYDELFKEHRKIKLENKIYEKKLEEMEADVEEQKERLQEQNQLLKKLYEKDSDSEISELQGLDKPIRTEAVSHKTLTNARKPDYLDEKDFDFARQSAPRSQFDNFAKETIDHSRPRFLKKNFSTSNLKNPGFGLNNKASDNEESQLRINNKSKERSRNKYNHLRHSRNSNNLSNSREKQQQSYRGDNKYKLEVSDYYSAQEGEGEDLAHEQSSSMISQDGLKNEIFKIDKEIMEIQRTLAKELEMNN